MVKANSGQGETLQAYDAIAPVYGEYSEKYSAYLDAVERLVLERLPSGARLLDVGSGDGRRLKKIAEARGLTDVVAVEPSSKMAAICRTATGFPVHELCGDELDQLQESPFDAITALWNVLGHMAGSPSRLSALRQMAGRLKPGGSLMLDVNNRHNRAAYGRWKVLGRRFLDALCFDERRGDASFEWKIGDRSFPAMGHLFTPVELSRLFADAELKVIERFSIDYRNGAVGRSPFAGQLFYRLGRG